jgi:DNA polymerase IV
VAQKWIMHLDMDAFFAAIEQRDDPSLRGKPVIIGAKPGGRGVVSTCSYEARKFGIHSAQPISQAYRRCPQGVFLRPSMEKYVAVSRQVMAVLEEVSPLVEPISIDEAFVDITGLDRLRGTPRQIGGFTKQRIVDELGLTASVGIGPNRLVAKLGSEYEKPDGLTVVPPEEVLDWLAPMSVARLRGVGPQAQKKLARIGIKTVAQLRAWRREDLARNFGAGYSDHLYDQSRGIGGDTINTAWERKSISKEVTFGEDVTDPEELLDTLLYLAQEVGRICRCETLQGTVVTLKIRLEKFETHTRQTKLDHATCSDRSIYRAARELFQASGFAGRAVRLIGLGVSDWESDRGRQLDLGFVSEQSDQKLFEAVDALNAKFGRQTVRLGPGRKPRGKGERGSE